jgi:hypothetical protein
MNEQTNKSFEFKGIPTFRILNFDKAINFYIDLLGFKVDWEHRFGPAETVYMQISSSGLVLHLSENKRFHARGVVFIETKGITAFHRELADKATLKDLPQVVKTNWQTLQLELEDPFGNLLRFNENV